ncbi:MAG: asparagine synthase (glutamine-hydrolyzing) [Gammaproteobacteria bacterium]
MCGLVAVLSPALNVREDLLIYMRDRLIHRGPDYGDIWISSDKKTALAHRRLSIIDKSDFANQPMSSNDNSSHLVFNGEIYNYIEIKTLLEKKGYVFKTHSDTEVLLASLLVWGEDALSRLNGMFAFALWNNRNKTLMIARDRFGEKPLFIGKGEFNTTVIASEMKAILPHPLISDDINYDSLNRFTRNDWFEHDKYTFFNNIERFPASHAAIFNKNGEEIKRWRYWSPKFNNVYENISPKQAVEEFGALLTNSVNLRLRTDVQVGSSLSGGLDSSAIVGMMARHKKSNLIQQNTFSAVFPMDPTISEDKEIDEVVSYTGVNKYTVTPSQEGLVAESKLLHWHQEEPFLSASIYLQWCVARLAKQNKTVVLLDGQGADELLAGYQFYFKCRQFDLIEQGKLNLARRETAKFNRRLKIAGSKYANSTRRFNHKVAYAEDELNTLRFKIKKKYTSHSMGTKSTLRKTLFDAMFFNSLPMLLRYADRNSMAFSRETRLPFLDYNLVDYCMQLPDDYYIRNGWQKWILRAATKEFIPTKIRWRADKVGYAAPLDIWLRERKLKDWAYTKVFDHALYDLPEYNLEEISKLWNQHQSGHANNSWALWRWISLSEWLSIYKSGYWKRGMPGQPCMLAM